MEIKMTPCEKLGYKVGDRFRVLNTSLYPELKCEYVTLNRDDGSYWPFFTDGKYEFCFGIDDGDLEYMADTSLKTGDEITQDGKKYRVTLEEIPQYEFKPGMIFRVDWDKADASCVYHAEDTRVVYLEKSTIHLGKITSGREKIAYATIDGFLAIGFVNTSSLRPE